MTGDAERFEEGVGLGGKEHAHTHTYIKDKEERKRVGGEGQLRFWMDNLLYG